MKTALVPAVLAFASVAFAAGTDDEERFLADNEAAMSRMMEAMPMKSSGDVDRDFVAMMVPHHQGAIDMAQAQLRYGSNEQLRRLAQEIIVTQQQEIEAMKLAIDEPRFQPSAACQSIPNPDPMSGITDLQPPTVVRM